MPVASTPLPEVIGLEAAHEGRAGARHQIRIFAKCFLDPAPARLARHIQHRRERLVRADRLHLRANDRAHRLGQLGLPGAGQPDDLRKAGGAAGHIAATGFFVHNCRDAQPRLLDQKALDRVRQPRRIGRPHAARAADAGDLPDAVRHQGARLFRRKRAIVEQLVHPGAAQLRDLFIERHAFEQILDALGDRPGRITIDRGRRRCRRCHCFILRNYEASSLRQHRSAL